MANGWDHISFFYSNLPFSGADVLYEYHCVVFLSGKLAFEKNGTVPLEI
jgi:hypothetical protein